MSMDLDSERPWGLQSFWQVLTSPNVLWDHYPCVPWLKYVMREECLSQCLAQSRGLPLKCDSPGGERRKNFESPAGESVEREHTAPRANIKYETGSVFCNIAKLFKSCLLKEMSSVHSIGPILRGPRTVSMGFVWLWMLTSFCGVIDSCDIYCFH